MCASASASWRRRLPARLNPNRAWKLRRAHTSCVQLGIPRHALCEWQEHALHMLQTSKLLRVMMGFYNSLKITWHRGDQFHPRGSAQSVAYPDKLYVAQFLVIGLMYSLDCSAWINFTRRSMSKDNIQDVWTCGYRWYLCCALRVCECMRSECADQPFVCTQCSLNYFAGGCIE